jgi:hypothetical protein
VPPGFPGFAIFGSLAILEHCCSLDPMALRHQVSLVFTRFALVGSLAILADRTLHPVLL